ncbi:CocE/NonD family hydrolase [Gleimia hominis]|uniref:CocE/NonD family hydrolase n=1 Tax=Gleimia hominis TaxID=595468 RepID=UPI000C808C43|nr:CocE/NonD family hydrolase [Gleimia hominis]WIK64461.1 CocE/NonD family hydrolase [Gleimia hominis]
MRIQTKFPYEVKVNEGWVPLSDGTQLWMKAWMPVTTEKVPVILEYLPYRAGDWTAPRDHERHPYYAGHGYASVRVDIRGHGNSEGVPGDEYSEQEHADGVEVINWLAAQPWSTGKVGMFGISWGGFNSLQLAALSPEPLKAIVTTCSTDDRYDNDVHYFGGSMLAVDMHAWAATMLAFESRPPDKRVWGDKWRDQWLYRLERMDPYLNTWMKHQVRDEYWKHGSVCEDYSQINAAVMAVGGWNDPYRDTVLRLVKNLSSLGKNVRGILGPWAHQYPDRDLKPGPHIDFLGETLRWWDKWLKDEETGVMNEPLLRTWITDPIPPSSVYVELPGRWVAEESWPSPNITPTTWKLTDAKGYSVENERCCGEAEECIAEDSAAVPNDSWGVLSVNSPQDTGQNAGRYFPFGNDADLPTDQRADDGRSVTFDFPVEQPLEILGNAELKLRIQSGTPKGQVYVRLVDVAPDGAATLVTRGNLNFSAREGRDKRVLMPTGEWVDVHLQLTGAGYHFARGHRVRVSISSAYWPWIWPQPGGEGFKLDVGACEITLPERRIAPEGVPARQLDESVTFGDPVQPPALPVKYPQEGKAGSRRPERLTTTDVVARETMLQVDPAYGGTRVYPDGLHFDEDSVERYWIKWDDPTSARTESIWRVGLSRPDMEWDASLEADTWISCDEENFYTKSSVTCYEGAEEIFARTWEETIPRYAS